MAGPSARSATAISSGSMPRPAGSKSLSTGMNLHRARTFCPIPRQMLRAWGASCLRLCRATPALIAAARDHSVPLLPASASPSEAMLLLEHGYGLQKFFPAEPSGGAAYLASLASPLPQVKFCPTGGLTQDNAPHYLKLANV